MSRSKGSGSVPEVRVSLDGWLPSSSIEANDWFKARYQEMQLKYGTDWVNASVAAEYELVCETTRAFYVLLAQDSSKPDASVLRYYSIPQSIIVEVCGGTDVDVERRSRRVDKQRAMDEWIKNHIGHVITPNDLAEAGDVSYATAIKMINGHAARFLRVGRGQYEVRDVESERAVARRGK
jgi:hypothetical protein